MATPVPSPIHAGQHSMALEPSETYDYFRLDLPSGFAYRIELDRTDLKASLALSNDAALNVQWASGAYKPHIAAFHATNTLPYRLSVSGPIGEYRLKIEELTERHPDLLTIGRNLLRAGSDKNISVALLPLELGRSDRDGVISNLITDWAGDRIAVATLNYQFFTGSIPTEAGVDYLVSAAGPNPNNLNSEYYYNFNPVNRYINFAVNLGRDGEAQAKFAAEYGHLTLREATAKAYQTIFGAAADIAKVDALLGGRVDYFAAYGGDGPAGIGTKAAMIGWLLAEAERGQTGAYARANTAFLTDLIDGAPFGIDLIAVYGSANLGLLAE